MMFCRKTKYFIDGRLDWDTHSHDGRAVREQVKPLEVCIREDCFNIVVGAV